MARRKHRDQKRATVSAGALAVGGAVRPSVPVSLAAPFAAAVAAPTLARGAAGRVVELTAATFASAIDGHPFAVIDVWSPSSAACRAFVPVFAAAAARHPDVLFAKVDADAERAMVAQLGITSVPTLIVFRSNVIVHAKPGALAADEFERVLADAHALDMDDVRRKVTSVETVAAADAANIAAPSSHGAAFAAAEDPLSIEAHLRPAARSAARTAGAALAAGRLVAIRDAFDPEFAERMHRALDRCANWRLHEGYEEHFHYHHHNLYDVGEFPADVAWCARILDSPATKAWVTKLSGRSCAGPAEVSASWYLPGDHSLPHNDIAASDARSHRQVAFVWHLAKDWRSEWGGALFWCENAQYLPPVFNTLWLFNVGPRSNHFVTHVSPYANGKRLAINGWWTGAAATQGAGAEPEAVGGASAGILVY